MKNFLYSWIVSFFSLVTLDCIWFFLTVASFYRPYIGHIISNEFRYGIALIFYLIYSFGISYLIIVPSLSFNTNLWSVTCKGLVFGIAAYSAYDLTNHATIKDWPAIVTIIDILWGAFVTSAASAISYKILAS